LIIDLRKSYESFFAHGIFFRLLRFAFSLLRSKERVATAKMQSLADIWQKIPDCALKESSITFAFLYNYGLIHIFRRILAPGHIV
jgi:hypothetical protein